MATMVTMATTAWENDAAEPRSSSCNGQRRARCVVVCRFSPRFSNELRTCKSAPRYRRRVDVTEEFPHLATKLSPYYDR